MSYDVGYKKPPRASQFVPGQSGNLKGRPKGSKNKSTILKKVLSSTVSIRENGETRIVTREEAGWLAMAGQAMRGSFKHMMFLMTWKEKMEKADDLDVTIKAFAQTMGDAAVKAARFDDRLPASRSPKDVCLWGEKKGLVQPSFWAWKERLDVYLDSSEDFDPPHSRM
jgi:hypothetical protein